MGDPSRRGFISVLAVLLSTGWAANHFASLIPVLRVDEGLSHTVLDGVFGIYALGLLPGLLTGGALSDRVGRAVVVLPGALIASLGTLILLLWHDAPGLMVGRLVVGIGAGLAIGAGTAWAADLRGKSGTVMAGVVLTSGFALGHCFRVCWHNLPPSHSLRPLSSRPSCRWVRLPRQLCGVVHLFP